MRLKELVPIITLLTFMSCSDINKVKTDGTRVLNGKIVQALYVDTDEKIEEVKSQIVERYGNPDSVTVDGGLVWNISNTLPILGGFTITKTVYFDSISHFEGDKEIFDFIRVTECITDKDGNDLLIKSSVRDSAKKYLKRY
ncbi:MAG: hypothetical protein HC847_29775 [Hydrococcus sp. RU_2_2]|nr:hypothetical protein [Hydrococcus sp. RU_2_2]